jgi:anthranilate phosphoribosyltransferase
VLLNTAAALVVAGQTNDLREGIAFADRALKSGAALAALETLRRVSAA